MLAVFAHRPSERNLRHADTLLRSELLDAEKEGGAVSANQRKWWAMEIVPLNNNLGSRALVITRLAEQPTVSASLAIQTRLEACHASVRLVGRRSRRLFAQRAREDATSHRRPGNRANTESLQGRAMSSRVRWRGKTVGTFSVGNISRSSSR